MITDRPVRAVVFDLFHTLIDTEHLRPAGFRAVSEVAKVLGADQVTFEKFWGETYVERETSMLELLAATAARSSVGVLSNCHAREVRSWPSSPLREHVSVFGRSGEIGVMKPELQSYEWVLGRLGVDAGSACFVGNGSRGELEGARAAGFATVVHCNVFDRNNGLVTIDEQRRRARVAARRVRGRCPSLARSARVARTHRTAGEAASSDADGGRGAAGAAGR